MVVLALFAGCAHRAPRAERAAPPPDPYHFPLSSPGSQFASLTPPVQNAIRAQVGGAQISQIIKDPVTGRVDVYFVNDALFPPLHVARDGSILGPDLSVAVGAPRDESVALVGGPIAELKPADLPQRVSDTVRQKAPGAAIEHISKETWGNQPVYIITFRSGSKQPRLYISSDGTVVHQVPK